MTMVRTGQTKPVSQATNAVIKPFHKVQLISREAGLRNLTFLIDFQKCTLIKLQLKFIGTIIPLRLQSLPQVKVFNRSILILLIPPMVLHRDIMVFNSISMLDRSIQLRVRDKISRCIPCIYHLMERRKLLNITVSLLLPWDSCSLLRVPPEISKLGKSRLSMISSIHSNGLKQPKTQSYQKLLTVN